MNDLDNKGTIIHDETPLKQAQFLHAREAAITQTRSPWEVLKENMRVMFAIVAVQSQALIFGVETVFLNGLVGNQAFCKTMGVYDAASDSYSVAAWKISLWAGIYALSQFAGQMVIAWLCDKFGRRFGLYAVSLVTYIGVAMEVVSPNWKVYAGAKVIMGFATGALMVSVPTYVAEVAPREIRGGAIGIFAFNVTFGALIGSLITYAGNASFPDVNDNRGWKVPLYVGLAAPTISIILMLLSVRESPYSLTLRGKFDQALNNIRILYPQKTNEEVQEEAEVLIYTIEMEQQQRERDASVTVWDCFRGVNRRRTFIATLPSLTTALIGNSLVQVYSTYFFTLAKIEDSLAASCVVSALGLCGTLFSYLLVEKKTIGRFWLLFWSCVLMTVCMLGVGAVNTGYHGDINKQGGYVLVFFVALFNVGSSLGSVSGWAYLGESASVQLRARTSALASSTNAIVGGFWNIVLPYELAAIGPTTGYMFFGFGIIVCILCWFFIPDLTGRTYAEMDELFEKKVPSRQFRHAICTGNYGEVNEEVSA